MSNQTRKSNRKNKTSGSQIKNFVLDTNVLIQDASALVNFAEHNVWLPHEVLEEMDAFKRENDDRGFNAREAFRLIDQILPDTASVQRGYTKPAGGLVRFVRPDPKATKALSTEFPDLEKADNRILAAALSLKMRGMKNVIMVSKDGNVRAKARILNLGAEDLQRDKVHEKELKPKRMQAEMPLNDGQIQALQSTGLLQLDPATTADLDAAFVTYLLITNTDKPGKTVPARYLGNGKFRKLKNSQVQIHGGRTISPKNLEQVFLFDALLDPSVKLITVCGAAGTGKTLAAIGCGLAQVQESHYDKLLVGRAIMPQGNDVGFLPGGKDEKLASWVRPAIDNIEFLMPTRRRPEDNGPQFEGKRQSQRKQKNNQQPQRQQEGEMGRELRPHERLIKAGLLELEILARIRGASISNAFFICDEFQNTTRLQAKTIVTRMGYNSKLVVIGDLEQIDAPYVDRLSNGLAHTIVSMRGDPEHVHIDLVKGERSRLAEAAAKRM